MNRGQGGRLRLTLRAAEAGRSVVRNWWTGAPANGAHRALASVFCLVLLLGTTVRSAVGLPRGHTPDAPASAPAETWALRKIQAGQVADMRQAPLQSSNRTLRPAFLTALLTGSLQNGTVPKHAIRISHARVLGPVDLSNATVPYDVSLDDCFFASTVNLMTSHWLKSLTLDHSTLAGKGPHDAYLYGIHVENDVRIRRTTFAGPVQFESANIGGNLEANGVQFLQGVSFYNSSFGGFCAFTDYTADQQPRNACFGGNANFSLVRAGSFDAERAGFGGRTLMRSMAVAADLILDRTNFRFGPDLSSTKVGGTASFRQTFLGSRVVLEGFTYGVLNLPDESTGWSADQELSDRRVHSWRSFLARARFSPTVYASLEDYYQKHGGPDIANAIFIMSRRKQADRLRPLQKLGDGVLYWIAGYGREPWRALLPIALFVAMGAVFFRSGMEYQKEGEKPYYNALWYSLDAFLPIIDLRIADVWLPNPGRFAANQYLRLHIILGWVLVTIGAAALTGFLK